MLFTINLQLFAEDAGSGSIGADSGPVGQNPAGMTAPADQGAAGDFDSLLNSNAGFKAEFDSRMRKAVEGRHKDYKAMQDRIAAQTPLYEMLASKYGIQAGEDGSYDQQAIIDAVTQDDSYYEDEAMERGMTVAQLKEIKSMQRENESLRRQMEEREQDDHNRAMFSQWMQEADQIKQIYPGFNLEAEIANPQFMRLVMNGVPLKGAFEAVHIDELKASTMQFTAQRVAENVANAYQANKARPRENGIGRTIPSSSEMNPAALTKEQRKEIRERVNRGERITF